jgi:hypothetical protein
MAIALKLKPGRRSSSLNIRLADPPGRRVRHPRVEGLALLDQIIEAPHYFFYRRHLIPHVKPVKIDVIRC